MKKLGIVPNDVSGSGELSESTREVANTSIVQPPLNPEFLT
jgi:hypothetical protein